MSIARTARPSRHAVSVTAALAVAGSLFAVPSAALAADRSPVQRSVLAAAAPTTGAHPILRRGSTGASVREWQTVMTYVLGEGSVAVDGLFGPRTATATREVQRTFDLPDDGIVGPLTWAATAVVHAPVDPDAVDPTTIDGPVSGVGHLELGDRGARVEHWQRLLDADPRSTSSTVADGIFGPATLASTKAFQTRYGLDPDGVVGPNTRATMQDVRDDV